jgi:hypothetical protein
MSKKIDINIILVIVLIIMVIVALVILLNFKKPSVTSNSSGTAANGIFPLKYGSQGNEVKTLQKTINANLDANDIANNRTYVTAPERLVVDGIFGDKTLKFVRQVFGQDTVSKSELLDYLAKSPM